MLVKMERPAPFRICVDHPPVWAEPTYGRSRPCPVLPILMRSFSGWMSTGTRSRRGSRTRVTDSPDVEKIFNDEESIRRLIGRFPDRRLLRVCYEAGPTGYDLARLLGSMGVRCEVIAPSMIPKAPGDKVKTDKRDCRRLARLHRAGELVAVRVPTPRGGGGAGSVPHPGRHGRGPDPGPEPSARSSCCATRGCIGVGAPGRVKHEAWLAAQQLRRGGVAG